MCPSTLVNVFAEYRFDVDDWRSVQRLEIGDAHSATLDRGDLRAVQTDRIRPVRRARTEDTLQRTYGVASGMHA